MSAKWRRSQEWERRRLTGALTPVRWVLHAFSSIWLAATWLTLVALYAVAASVPVGVLMKFPTYAIYALTLVGVVLAAVAPIVWLTGVVLRRRGMPPGGRFAVGFGLTLVLGAGGIVLWEEVVWPLLRYDSTAGTGLMLWAGTIERYRDVAVRRLPGMEMTELQFYAWWPLATLLYLFVLNMATATVRRIEFRFENLGVLTVHGGIMMLALGSTYYASAKLEGDLKLYAGPIDPATGNPTLGPPEDGFFDNTNIKLLVSQRGRKADFGGTIKDVPAEERLVDGMPRYNEYNLDALRDEVGPVLQMTAAPLDEGRTLDIPVQSNLPEGWPRALDDDLNVRVVGFAPYVYRKPLRLITGTFSTRDAAGKVSTRPAFAPLQVSPMIPAASVAPLFEGLFIIQYTTAMTEELWEVLGSPLPGTPDGSALHALRVRLPGQKVTKWFTIKEGQRLTVGEPAWNLEVRAIKPQNTQPFISEGYEGASSSEVSVVVTPPAGAAGVGGAEPFVRYVFSRYPSLSQDLLAPLVEGGRPRRRPPAPEIELAYLDASVVQVFIDEAAPQGEDRPEPRMVGSDPEVRAVVRLPGQNALVYTGLRTGSTIPVADRVVLTLGPRVLVPIVAPKDQRQREAGDYRLSLAAVEVRKQSPEGLVLWSKRRWLPFTEHHVEMPVDVTPFDLPDGRVVDVTFGRQYHPLPGLQIRLRDFEMIPFPHSEVPRDYRSDLLLARTARAGDEREVIASTSMNEPLLASPYVWSREGGTAANVLGWVGDQLGPQRFKFSQVAWDRGTWTQTLEDVRAGRRPRPYVRWTILGIGNNPGIRIIALGAIMLSLGIPWAFYVKPWILRRRKRLIQAQVAAGTYVAPAPRGAAREGHTNGRSRSEAATGVRP